MVKSLLNLKTTHIQNYKKFDKIDNISFNKELKIGLSKKNKKIPSKFHYDLNGSRYFEKITKLKEYYVTRTEKKILQQVSNEMKNIFDNNLTFVEFGSGATDKIGIFGLFYPAHAKNKSNFQINSVLSATSSINIF